MIGPQRAGLLEFKGPWLEQRVLPHVYIGMQNSKLCIFPESPSKPQRKRRLGMPKTPTRDRSSSSNHELCRLPSQCMCIFFSQYSITVL
ncbi:hypothetical protein E2C01_099761 [Portunus trituberculatus]|uniref:Uncharacterized protein n=1 Tax=Portunus trituberculatus TaxID=210409 RepID=A0A5B7K4M2_PORTR|nr:hypothetical protein [Portunus trituberculatus]